MPNMCNPGLLKKEDSGYDYMYIGLLMGFISRFSQMDGQHWFEL